MIPITAKPDPGGGFIYPDYRELVDSFGYTVLASEELGSYQGDYIFILRREESPQLGLLTFGYGSCSGCDTLCSIIGYDFTGEERDRIVAELTTFRDKLAADIRWGTAQEHIDRLTDPDGPISWWSGEAAVKRKLVRKLRKLAS